MSEWHVHCTQFLYPTTRSRAWQYLFQVCSVDSIEAFATVQEQQGVTTYRNMWKDSLHCQHYRSHSEEYEQCCLDFVLRRDLNSVTDPNEPPSFSRALSWLPALKLLAPVLCVYRYICSVIYSELFIRLEFVLREIRLASNSPSYHSLSPCLYHFVDIAVLMLPFAEAVLDHLIRPQLHLIPHNPSRCEFPDVFLALYLCCLSSDVIPSKLKEVMPSLSCSHLHRRHWSARRLTRSASYHHLLFRARPKNLVFPHVSSSYA